MKTTPTVSIIGAGVAGLSCAHHLKQHDISCVVIDKSADREVVSVANVRRRARLIWERNISRLETRLSGAMSNKPTKPAPSRLGRPQWPWSKVNNGSLRQISSSDGLDCPEWGPLAVTWLSQPMYCWTLKSHRSKL